MMYLDLSELDEVLTQSSLWSTSRWALASFRRADYFSYPSDTASNSIELPSIDQSVRSAVESKLGVRPSGAIRVLTNLRYFGYLINPISCYYCFDKSNQHLQAMLIEVTNTPWGQRTHYVLDLRQYQPGESIDFDKDMHVSPFMPMAMTYRWKGKLPGELLSYTLASFLTPSAQTDGSFGEIDQTNSQPVGVVPHHHFDSGVNFKRIEISARSLNRVLWQYPWMTGKVACAIYWQALKLWVKRIPFVAHPDRLDRAGK